MIGKMVERDGKQKLYVQVYAILKENIEQGVWPIGSMIATEDDLCRSYNVSKATVREAIAELVREGYVNRQQGKGTFVMCSGPQKGLKMRTMVTEDISGKESATRKEVLARGITAPSEAVKGCMQADDAVQYFLTRRLVDEEPVYLDESYFPYSLFSDLQDEDLIHRSVYEIVEGRAGIKIVKIVQTIEITNIESSKAAILGIEESSPVLTVHRTILGAEGRPMAYTRLDGLGTRYKMQMEFERIG